MLQFKDLSKNDKKLKKSLMKMSKNMINLKSLNNKLRKNKFRNYIIKIFRKYNKIQKKDNHLGFDNL